MFARPVPRDQRAWFAMVHRGSPSLIEDTAAGIISRCSPEDELVILTVERIDNGVVSPYFHGDVRPGDRFELRGPIGGYFVWTIAAGGSLQLIAGGAGISPLMAMVRHRERRCDHAPALLLYSSKSLEDVIFSSEIDAMAHRDRDLWVVETLTFRRPEGWRGYRRRIRETARSVFSAH